MLSQLTQKLIDALQNLPGIGPKTAQRLAFQLLSPQSRTTGLHLSETLAEALHSITQCSQCRNYTENMLCSICQSSKRDASILCVVETPIDALAIENSHQYHGRYFILHGHISPIDGVGPEELGIFQLIDIAKQNDVLELIIATNTTMEGEATAYYIAEQFKGTQTKCSRIAHGVPIGGELEYLDSITLSHALQTRTTISTTTTKTNEEIT